MTKAKPVKKTASEIIAEYEGYLSFMNKKIEEEPSYGMDEDYMDIYRGHVEKIREAKEMEIVERQERVEAVTKWVPRVDAQLVGYSVGELTEEDLESVEGLGWEGLKTYAEELERRYKAVYKLYRSVKYMSTNMGGMEEIKEVAPEFASRMEGVLGEVSVKVLE